MACTPPPPVNSEGLVRRRAGWLQLVRHARIEVEVDLRSKRSPGRVHPQIRAALGSSPSHIIGTQKMPVEWVNE